jgi:uncharacterized membrane protein YhaH (DUF805 family)
MTELQQKEMRIVKSERRTFAEAMRVCLIDKYACFRGRASRSEYWWAQLGIFLLIIAVLVLCVILDKMGLSGAAGILLFAFILGIILPGYALVARRLHDSNNSAWWILLSIPLLLIGLRIIFDVVVGLLPPVDAGNRYND